MIFAPAIVTVEAGLGHDDADLALCRLGHGERIVWRRAHRKLCGPGTLSADVGALACSLAALLLAGGGGKAMETTLQDDALLLHRSPAQVRRTARRAAALGADRVRITAGWSALSPQPRARRLPGAPFDASDSATYPAGSWRALDTAVRAADDAGLKVQLDIGFWAPRWAVHRGSRNHRERWWPDPALFGDFANAVARRYSGGFRDPADPRRRLPAVRMYTPWNEPNHPSFLAPQWAHDGHGGWRPESPHIYRAMYEAAYRAIKRVSPLDAVLLGGTAASGSTTPGRGGVPPLQFVRALACVDDRLEPLTIPECRGFRALQADGYAHHPYSRTTTPATSSPLPDDVPLADTGRLTSLLDALAARGRIRGRLDVYDTEYGYESRQDDPFAPFGRAAQAAYLGWASYLAWSDPRTRMFAQFLLQDVDPRESGRRPGTRAYYRDWQTGLYDARGRPKPALEAFKLPFWAQVRGDPGHRVIVAWGMVRPHRGAEIVRVERRTAAGAWVGVGTVGPTCDAADGLFRTDVHGVFQRAIPVTPATGRTELRFSWRHPDGSWEAGAPLEVDPAVPVALPAGG